MFSDNEASRLKACLPNQARSIYMMRFTSCCSITLHRRPCSMHVQEQFNHNLTCPSYFVLLALYCLCMQPMHYLAHNLPVLYSLRPCNRWVALAEMPTLQQCMNILLGCQAGWHALYMSFNLMHAVVQFGCLHVTRHVTPAMVDIVNHMHHHRISPRLMTTYRFQILVR